MLIEKYGGVLTITKYFKTFKCYATCCCVNSRHKGGCIQINILIFIHFFAKNQRDFNNLVFNDKKVKLSSYKGSRSAYAFRSIYSSTPSVISHEWSPLHQLNVWTVWETLKSLTLTVPYILNWSQIIRCDVMHPLTQFVIPL